MRYRVVLYSKQGEPAGIIWVADHKVESSALKRQARLARVLRGSGIQVVVRDTNCPTDHGRKIIA